MISAVAAQRLYLGPCTKYTILLIDCVTFYPWHKGHRTELCDIEPLAVTEVNIVIIHIGTTSHNCYMKSVPPSDNCHILCIELVYVFHVTAKLDVSLACKVFLSLQHNELYVCILLLLNFLIEEVTTRSLTVLSPTQRGYWPAHKGLMAP